MVTSLLRKGFGRAAIASLIVFCISPASFAALLVEFQSLPISQNAPEVAWNGSALVAAPTAAGSQGNGDGLLLPGSQTIGGLIIETPLTISGATAAGVGATINAGNGGSTTFTDVTMIINSLNSAGPATDQNGIVNQLLGGGNFKLVSTDPPGAVTSQDLLVGNISTAVITGITNANAGSVLSSTVTYTGGLILDALNASLGNAPGTPISGGSLTFTLLDIDNPLHIGTGTLAAFTANSNGQFGTPVVPEPGSIMVLALGVIGLGVRRRKNN